MPVFWQNARFFWQNARFFWQNARKQENQKPDFWQNAKKYWFSGIHSGIQLKVFDPNYDSLVERQVLRQMILDRRTSTKTRAPGNLTCTTVSGASF